MEVDFGGPAKAVSIGRTPIQALPPLETVDAATLDALPPALKRELEEAWGAFCSAAQTLLASVLCMDRSLMYWLGMQVLSICCTDSGFKTKDF